MYAPRHFVEERDEVVLALVRSAGFGHLVVTGPDGLEATPIPFVVDDAMREVRVHVARANPVWRAAPCDALLIVPVTDAYVSPSWYPSKAEHGKVVPTWNYEVVHLHGRLSAHDDTDWVRRQVVELTDLNESALPRPWGVTDAPADYIDATQRGIVGIGLSVERVEAKRKLSQNRPAGDIDGVTAGLAGRDDRRSAGVLDGMRR